MARNPYESLHRLAAKKAEKKKRMKERIKAKNAKPSGRPKYQPTDEIRNQVSMMAAFGLKRIDIYNILGIASDTFREHYEENYQTGLAKAVATIGAKLYKTAASEKQNSLTAQMFFLKTRGGWKESNNVQLTGKDGGPIEVESHRIIKAEEVDPEMRDMLIDVLERALVLEEQDAAGIADEDIIETD